MKRDCKTILDQYYKSCVSKYFSQHSVHYQYCQRLIQDYQKCIGLQKHFTNSVIHTNKSIIHEWN